VLWILITLGIFPPPSARLYFVLCALFSFLILGVACNFTMPFTKGTTMPNANDDDDKKVAPQHHDVEGAGVYDDASILGKGDILQLEHTDPVLNAKMHLVNNAIGMFCTRMRLASH
jgi:hypothetical protein